VQHLKGEKEGTTMQPITSDGRPSISGVGPCLFALAVIGCANRQSLVQVDNVDVVGARAIKERKIIAGLATHDPTGLIFHEYAEYDEVSVARDRERIESFYQHEGHFSARVTNVEIRKKRSGRQVEVVFTVEEGEPTRIAAIDLQRMPPVPPGAAKDLPLEELILVKKGRVYKQAEYLGSRDNLKGYLVREGYAYAQVAGIVEVDRDKREATIRYQIDAGPLAKFGPTQVVGLENLPESAIRARIDWKEGEPYNPRKVEVTRGRLYQMGFLASVGIEIPEKSRPEVAEVKILVRESLRRELQLGGGVALDNANFLLRPRVGYIIRGARDPLLTLSFDARPGFIVAGQGTAGQLAGEVSTTLARDDLLFPRLKGTASIVGELVELETYAARGLRSKIGLERPFLGDKLQVGLGYQFRLLNFTSVADVITAEDRTRVGLPQAADIDANSFSVNSKLGYFDQLVSLDLRDNPLNTKNGIYLELRAEEAGAFSGSAFPYVKVTPEARGYYAPLSIFGFATRLRYGAATSENVPITQRYFSGGASSHRGFTFRRLSPMSSVSDINGHRVPIGGDTLLETSTEARLDLFKLFENWLGLVVFLDGGDVTLTQAQLDVTHLHWAAGAGLRYNTLVGPIRFDVGYRLNRFGEGEPDPGQRVAFHFSIGQAF
jgi:outer membrane protein assembly factor BamA